ncbi:MAG: hypothetical protein WA324_19925 [Bryobacteraceae bacterium]
MPVLEFINTSAQTVSAAGPVTGTLSTSSVSGNVTLSILVTNLTLGASMEIAIEDTASASAFSDALQVWTQQFSGGLPPEGDRRAKRAIELPRLRIGAVNNALRLNILSLTAGASAQVWGWIEVG